MFDPIPPPFQKPWGNLLRQSQHWQDKSFLLSILESWGITPPDNQCPYEWAEMSAKALAQRWAPRGRPRKGSRKWKQLELPLILPAILEKA